MSSGITTLNKAVWGYSAAEWRAILDHKYFLGVELHTDPGLELVINSWERNHAIGWRSQRMRRDAEDQVQAIESHRAELTARRGAPIDFNEAAHDWVARFGDDWRRRREAV